MPFRFLTLLILVVLARFAPCAHARIVSPENIASGGIMSNIGESPAHFQPQREDAATANTSAHYGVVKWLSEDPIGEQGGINLYGYVGNGPIGAVDPLGLRDILPKGFVGPPAWWQVRYENQTPTDTEGGNPGDYEPAISPLDFVGLGFFRGMGSGLGKSSVNAGAGTVCEVAKFAKPAATNPVVANMFKAAQDAALKMRASLSAEERALWAKHFEDVSARTKSAPGKSLNEARAKFLRGETDIPPGNILDY